MARLSFNEAALIYCILGSPSSNNKEERYYPEIDEAIEYMLPKEKKRNSGKKITVLSEEKQYMQMQLF